MNLLTSTLLGIECSKSTSDIEFTLNATIAKLEDDDSLCSDSEVEQILEAAETKKISIELQELLL